MSRSRAATYVRFLTIFALLGALGIGATVYVLVHQRVRLPFERMYTIRAQFAAADGVVSGVGQPVDVVGVNVGQVTNVALSGGTALVTMELQRSQLPRVYANATADLRPVTPLDDMEINLQPGGPPAHALPAGATLPVGQTNAPVQLPDLLSDLDADTRNYLTALLGSVAEGIGSRGPDLRRMLSALGPTARQVGAISRALAQRRTELAQFVHNLALVTRAAAGDGQLTSVVAAGDRTLHALADQDAPLRQAIAQLPSTLKLTRSTLANAIPFAHTLGPALAALTPAVHALPKTLDAIMPFDAAGISALQRDVLPLVADARPLLAQAAPAVQDINRATPDIIGAAQTLNYFLNELGFVPGGRDQGFLFWLAWAVHNTDSALSEGDANGAIDRAQLLVQCEGIQYDTTLQKLLGIVGLCPK